MPDKIILYLVASFLMAGGGWFAIDKFHFSLKREITSLEKQLLVVGTALNTCEMNTTKEKLEGIIEGVGGIDENITIDFNNASY